MDVAAGILTKLYYVHLREKLHPSSIVLEPIMKFVLQKQTCCIMGRISVNFRDCKCLVCRNSKRLMSSFSNSRQKHPLKVKESFHMTMLNLSESSAFIFLRTASWGMYEMLEGDLMWMKCVFESLYKGMLINIICVAPPPLPPQCISCFWGFLQPPFHWWLSSCTGWPFHTCHNPGDPAPRTVRRGRRSGLLQRPGSPGCQSWCKMKSAVHFSRPRLEKKEFRHTKSCFASQGLTAINHGYG